MCHVLQHVPHRHRNQPTRKVSTVYFYRASACCLSYSKGVCLSLSAIVSKRDKIFTVGFVNDSSFMIRRAFPEIRTESQIYLLAIIESLRSSPYQPSSNWSYETHQLVSSRRRESTMMSNLPFSSHCEAHFDRLHMFRCSTSEIS